MDQAKIEHLIRELLVEMGEDPNREGLRDTPARVASMWRFATAGYHKSPEQLVGGAVFEQKTDNIVVLRNIEVYSMCEHHLLPFFGRVHVGYLADQKVLGVSKLARIVDGFARRLQMQERLTAQIAECIREQLGVRGVGVVLEAQHLCMMLRGVEKQNAVMVTSSMLGHFRDNAAARGELLALMGVRST